MKVNSDMYVKMLDEEVLPWLQKTYRGGYIFTQDGAPAHTADHAGVVRGAFKLILVEDGLPQTQT